MKTIKQIYHIKAPLSEVWQALVNPTYINGWGGGPAKMDERVGTKFSLWGGSIWGTNKEVIKEKKLVQEWYSESEAKKWDAPSIATFTLVKKGNEVIISFLHTQVPDPDASDIEKGWKKYYLGPLKKYLESKKSSA